MNINQIKSQIQDKQNKLQDMLDMGSVDGYIFTENESKQASELNAQVNSLKSMLQLYMNTEELKTWTTENFKHPSGKEIVTVKNGIGYSDFKGISPEKYAKIQEDDYSRVFREYAVKGFHALNGVDQKALIEGQDVLGGFLVPEQVQAQLIQKKQGLTPLSSRVQHFTTGRDSLTLPRSNWTTDNVFTSPTKLTSTGEVPANATTAQAADPTFGQTRIEVYTQMVNQSVSRDMLEDGLFDMGSWIATHFAEAVTQQTEGWVINGNGNKVPFGILAAPGTTLAGNVQPGVVPLWQGSTSNLITYAGLNALFYSVPEQYSGEQCWFFNKTSTMRGLDGITDGNGRPLFGLGYQDSGMGGKASATLKGAPYYYSNQMPNGYSSTGGSGTANAYPIIFGDPKGYALVERTALSVQVLDQINALTNEITYVGRYRVGGCVVEPWLLAVGKNSTS